MIRYDWGRSGVRTKETVSPTETAPSTSRWSIYHLPAHVSHTVRFAVPSHLHYVASVVL